MSNPCKPEPVYQCKFEFPIRLNVPITINPELDIKPVCPVEEDLEAFLDANIYVRPKIGANEPTCLPKHVSVQSYN